MINYEIGTHRLTKLYFNVNWDTIKTDFNKIFFKQNVNGTGIYTTGNIVNSPNIKILKDFLIQYIEPIFDISLNDINIEFTYVWINKYETGSNIQPHTHLNCDIASVLYLDLDENDISSSLLCLDDIKNEYKTIRVNKNDLLIFKGSLMHKSLPVQSTKPRYIMGVNMKLNTNKSII